MWKKGYRTKEICCILATLLYKSYFYEREVAGALEDAMEIAYGSPNSMYGEYSAAECMDRGAFHTVYHVVENASLKSRMEAVWENIHVRRYNKKYQRHYKAEQYHNYNDSNNDCCKIIFTYEYVSEDGCWLSREAPSRAAVIIDGTNLSISMIKIRGVDPTLEQATTMCFAAASHSVMIHKYSRDRRVHPFKINSRTGYSGCEDYHLDVYGRNGTLFYKKFTAAELHVSMAGKVSSITDMYVGDALELFTAASGYRDFNYRKRIEKSSGVRFVRSYKNEILSEEDMDFIPKEKSNRRPSRRRV